MSGCRTRCIGLLVALLVIAGFPAPPTAGQTSIPRDYTGLPLEIKALYFVASGHNLYGGFLRAWWERGQLDLFGLPITEELTENGRVVQYFERARFEYHPEARGTANEVQFSHLGRQVTRGRTDPAFEPVERVAETAEVAYFEATGHAVVFAFKNFWERNNGLATFGYPLSEEFRENGRTVQYFERARFEYYPEFAGADYEVQLGHLGRAVLQDQPGRLAAAQRRDDATTWADELPGIFAQRQRQERQQAALTAVPTPLDPFQGVVTAPVASVYRAPTVIADRLTVIYQRHTVHITGLAIGEPIGGDDRWYRLEPSGGYVAASAVAPFTPPPPPRTWPGRWIDANLSTFYVTAYEGDTPLYSALVTAGREDRTPVGRFRVQSRVRSETMDSATVGIPKGHKDYYYLKNVEYTQYFTSQGHALHGNYWVHPSRFGRFSSNGCLGLLNQDAAWFWQFAETGTLIDIHY